jgi:hypothetical protein
MPITHKLNRIAVEFAIYSIMFKLQFPTVAETAVENPLAGLDPKRKYAGTQGDSSLVT